MEFPPAPETLISHEAVTLMKLVGVRYAWSQQHLAFMLVMQCDARAVEHVVEAGVMANTDILKHVIRTMIVNLRPRARDVTLAAQNIDGDTPA